MASPTIELMVDEILQIAVESGGNQITGPAMVQREAGAVIEHYFPGQNEVLKILAARGLVGAVEDRVYS